MSKVTKSGARTTWERLIEELASSGERRERPKKLAARYGVNVQTLYWWRSKLRRDAAVANTHSSRTKGASAEPRTTERRELEALLDAVMAERDALLEEQKKWFAEQVKLRRKFWDTAAMKCEVSREALMRIGRIFERDHKRQASPREGESSSKSIYSPRGRGLFLLGEYRRRKVKAARSFLRSAFGYVTRHREALMRFLEDGRLKLETTTASRRSDA